MCLALLSTAIANAAFFEAVGDVVPASADESALILKKSITTPDGRFTYTMSLDEIYIFSREVSTGLLSEVGVLNAASYPGGVEGVRVSPKDIEVSPDGNFLYMAGIFGWVGSEGDAPIQRQYTVVKFDRNADTGSLTFNDFTDMNRLDSASISSMKLNSDGSLLYVARASGLEGTTGVHMITTTNMESQFILIESGNGESTLPASTELKLELSPDEQTLYLGGPINRQRKDLVPAMAVIDVSPSTNRLSVRQTLAEDYFGGLDTTIDLTSSKALYQIDSINASDDGRFVYTLGKIRTSEDLNSTSTDLIGVWNIENDGTLTLNRSLNKQEIVFDSTDGTGAFSFPTDLALTPNGNHFAYLTEDQSFPGEAYVTVFSRDSETGLLTYIDDDIGNLELDNVEDVDVSLDGRYVNITQGAGRERVSVVDTAVDTAVLLNNIDNPGVSSETSEPLNPLISTLEAIVFNNGPTDDYDVRVLFEASAGLTLTTTDADCETISDGSIMCSIQQLLVGTQSNFRIEATSSAGSTENIVTATASSNKIDIEASNDSATVATNGSSLPVESESSDNGGGGGCSIAGGRAAFDLSFVILLVISVLALFRRKDELQ